jgi:hypothetical protein
VGDITFIDSLLTTLATSDSIVCYTGNNHAIMINMFLELSGFKCVDAKGHLKHEDAVRSHEILSQLTPLDLEKGFIAFNNIPPSSSLSSSSSASPSSSSSTRSSSSSSSSTSSSSKACAACSKDDAKNMQCGRCGNVSYCSTDCQKSHWKTHKPYCKAPADTALVIAESKAEVKTKAKN